MPEPRAVRLEVATVGFRYSSYDTPFWARNNRSPGRWHLTSDGATQYLALHPDGAWAELARRENLRAEDELALVHMPIWAALLNEGRLADYSTFDKAHEAGFPPDALIDDNYERCQAEGHRLRQAGFGGVLAPSAALPGVVNVTLFGRRVLATWSAPTRLASSISAAVVAVGCPPEGLAPRVRHFGEVHTSHLAWAEIEAESRADEDHLDDDGHGGAPLPRRPREDPPSAAAP